MPWKVILPMEERKRFIDELLLSKRSFTDFCAEFGISRKTGYKWLKRFRCEGPGCFVPRSSRPKRSPKRTASWVSRLVIAERLAHPFWGPRKIRAKLIEKRLEPLPAASTLGLILKRANLVMVGRRRRQAWIRYWPGGLTVPTQCNQVWTVDFKGWFRVQNGQRCDPLTVRDGYSRFVLAIRAVGGQTYAHTRVQFEGIFEEYGIPEIIRVDNGSPFGGLGARGLSRLSAWWISLGIRVEFGRPACPQDNGGHERMHRDLKRETASPPAGTLRRQQGCFDRWRVEFNRDRPHEALKMRQPQQVYRKSKKSYEAVRQGRLEYPGNYEVRQVRTSGEIKWENRRYFIGEAFIGMTIGLVGKSEGIVEVYLRDLLLGVLDVDGKKFKPILRARRRKAQSSAGAGGRPLGSAAPSPRRERSLRARLPAQPLPHTNRRLNKRKKKTKVLPRCSV